MRKELIPQFLFFLIYFLLITLLKGWYALAYWPFWIGGVVGLLLPYVDHLIYIYFLRPGEEVSRNLRFLIASGKYHSVFKLLVGKTGSITREIIHTAHFQIIFLALTILVITSSGSIFGVGMVLAFALHLFVTQLKDYMSTGNIHLWFSKIGLSFNKQSQMWYVIANGIVLLLIALMM